MQAFQQMDLCNSMLAVPRTLRLLANHPHLVSQVSPMKSWGTLFLRGWPSLLEFVAVPHFHRIPGATVCTPEIHYPWEGFDPHFSIRRSTLIAVLIELPQNTLCGVEASTSSCYHCPLQGYPILAPLRYLNQSAVRRPRVMHLQLGTQGWDSNPHLLKVRSPLQGLEHRSCFVLSGSALIQLLANQCIQ